MFANRDHGDWLGNGSVQAVREPLRCELRPSDAALLLRGEERGFALIGAWAGGGAVLGSRPLRVVDEPEALFGALDAQPQIARGGSDVVGGGWFGFLGFRLGCVAERLDPPPAGGPVFPPGCLAFYDHVLRMDADGQWWFEALVSPERETALEARRDELAADLASRRSPDAFSTSDWRWTPTPAGHARVVDACRERIRCGDLFQANLCMRLEGRFAGDPLDLFATAASALPTDRAAYLTGPWGAVVSLSPELFLERRGRMVRTAPIKGTRPLDRRDELAASEKDRAENVMIVDLMRNDLGRVCTPGTVQVTALAEIRRHAGVWHLVSEVQGRLTETVCDADLLRATFPPGSVTGAPKIAALNVISELESTPRGAYTGAIGFVSPLHGVELSVAIRTFELRGSRIWIGTGGGIVADSRGSDEAAEAAAKVAPLFEAIGATPPQPPPLAGDAPAFTRRGPRPVPRPDASAGIYETIHVANGFPQRWLAHLARLTGSARRLYGRSPPADLTAQVLALAHGVTSARLRIDLMPGEDPQLELTPMPPSVPAILRPIVVPGGVGAHKWRDRALLEAHEADDPRTLPLLVDADGVVLESSRAGVLVRAHNGMLWTPPRDGRILPSVTVSVSRAESRQLTLEDLRHAESIYIASALRGVQSATLAVGHKNDPTNNPTGPIR